MSEKSISKMLFSNQEKVELSKIDDVRDLLKDAKSKFQKADSIKKELRSLISDAMIMADMNVKGQATNLIKQAEDLGADKKVSKSILEWASKDMYSQTRTYPKYSIIDEDRFWKPTPPDYMDGIEPHWPKIRTMVLDSSNQFPPKDPIPFNLKKGSPFHKQLIEVYEVTNSLTEEQTNIAKFWDCNPYVSHHKGHAMFATKKITPGGHWINICRIAAEKANSNDIESLRTYSLVSISLFDAFISCWDDKWKTIVVRPETVINEYIDEDWLPLLQTPPFPEYTSGHSVISRSAAIMLTEIYGDNFQFDDTSELEFGLPVRSYNSFIQASEEAAISRLYGGIHYEMAITNGVSQGKKIGEFITNKLTTLKK